MYVRTGLTNRTYAGYSDSGYTWPFDSMPGSIYGLAPSLKIMKGLTVSGDGSHPIYVWLKDNCGNVNHENRSQTTLYLDMTPPTNVGCSTPENNATDVPLNPTLVALTATDSGSGLSPMPYYFELATDTAFTQNLQQSGWQANTSWNPSTLVGGTVYYWRVRARDNVANTSDNCGHAADTRGYGKFTTLAVVDITLSGVPVAWGTIDPGTENNPATDNAHGFPMKIKVESTTNVNVDIYLKGTNWSDGAGHTMGVENSKFDDDNALGEGSETGRPENILKLNYPSTANSGYFEDVAPGSEKYIYFWISIPVGQWAGTYTNTIFVKAVKDGNTP